MAKSTKADFLKAKAFLGRLHATVQALPTEAEKAQAKERLAALGEFVKTLQAAVDSMPSIESVGRVKDSLAWLQDLFAKAAANPVLAGLVPVSSPPRQPRKPPQPLSEQDLAAGRADLDTIRALSAEDIRTRLLDEDGYSLSRVRAIAANLGIGATEKLSRESLAHQVTTKIANYRGYQALSGKDEGQGTEGSQASGTPGKGPG